MNKGIKFMIYFMYILLAIAVLNLFSIMVGLGAFFVLVRFHPDWAIVDVLMNSYCYAGLIGGVIFVIYLKLFKILKEKLDFVEEKDKMYLCNSHPDYDYIPKPLKRKKNDALPNKST